MIAVMVHINVKPDSIEAFKQASIINAQNSIQESGIARFDFIQQQEDPTKFLLIEVYASEEATLKHKETEHYHTWRDTVTPMMAEPRKGVRYDVIYPEDESWWTG
jgi:autoinducer 2-degrading protein